MKQLPKNFGRTKKLRVLVVDDDEHQLRSIRKYLTSAGISVITCTSASEGISALQGIPFSTVISDIRMPEESGLTLVEWAMENRPNIPIFVMTAFGSDEIYQDVMQKGALVYLEKPVDLKLLVQLLVTSQDNCKKCNNVVTVCLEAAASKGSGDVIIQSRNQIGQLFFYDGKIAWAAVQNNPTTFWDMLVKKKHIKKEQIAALIHTCKENKQNIFQEITNHHIVEAQGIKSVIHEYIADCFIQCMAWQDAKALYISNSRSFKGHILFDLVDILTLANVVK